MNELIPFEIPTDYSTLSNEQLDSLTTSVSDAVAKIREVPNDQLTDEHVEALETLATVVASVQAERDARQQRQTKSGELLSTLEAALAPANPEPQRGAEPAKEAALTAAAKAEGGARTAPRIEQIAQKSTQSVAQPTVSEREQFAVLVEGPDADGRKFESWFDVARVAERKLASYSGKTGFAAHTIATIHRQFPKELVVGEGEANKTLDYAASESRLPGGSLVAAAGWCAPSQTIYDMIELESTDGMVDLPEVQVTRGGIRHNPGPDFSSIFGGTGHFHLTEAQVISGSTKPTMEVPCPTFEDVRLEAVGVSVTGSLLQRRGYPEIIERFIRGALVAHQHKVNQALLAKMETNSTAVDLSTGADGTAASELLSAVELAVEDIRYRHRMPMSATVEVKIPRWAFALMRADLARRAGVDLLGITDAVITGYFAARGARVQAVYDWQDAFSGLTGGPGGDTPLTALPTTVKFMAYPAGTWVRGSDSVIRLDTVYDAAGLAGNKYQALFVEEGVLVAKRGHDSRVYTVAVCPSGNTASYTCAP